jgi:membrane fusion protein, multidrug efflux system
MALNGNVVGSQERAEGLLPAASHLESPGRSGMRNKRRIGITTALVTLAVVCIAGYLLYGSLKAHPLGDAADPPVPISSASAQQGDLSLWLTGLGTAQAYNTVTVKPRVSGQIVDIRFTEGELVHRGDILAQIDPLPFAAQLRLAQAAIAKDRVQLNNAKADLTRFTALSTKGFVTSQSLDTQKAQVATFEAAVRADQATADAAQIQLNYATIRTPIDGVTGIRMVDVGNVPARPNLALARPLALGTPSVHRSARSKASLQCVISMTPRRGAMPTAPRAWLVKR